MEIKHVAIYLRLSRDEENKGIEEMLASHRDTLTNYCKQQGWNYEIFEEIASSSSIEKRDKMVELLERIEQQEFDAIVVMDIDRLSRNEYDAVAIKKTLFQTGTSIATPTKFYNLSKDEDNLLLGIQSLIAAQEYKQILKRMQQGKLFSSKQGQWTNGLPPLGYDRSIKTKRLEPNEKADLIRYIFHSIIEGMTVSQLYQELNRMGERTRDGNEFTFVSVVRIINNENYKGTIISNRVIGKHDGERPPEEWIVVKDAHPAIVDEETWEKANKILNTFKRSKKRSENKTYPTSKLVFCYKCDRMHSVMRAKKNILYLHVCRNCYNRSFNYVAVLKLIKQTIETHRHKIIATIDDVETNGNFEEIEFRKKQLIQHIQKTNIRLKQIDVLFEEAEITLKEYKERKAMRKKEIAELTAELEKLENETPRTKINELQTLLEHVTMLTGEWEILDGKGLNNEQVNISLHYLIEKIIWRFTKEDEQPIMNIRWR